MIEKHKHHLLLALMAQLYAVAPEKLERTLKNFQFEPGDVEISRKSGSGHAKATVERWPWEREENICKVLADLAEYGVASARDVGSIVDNQWGKEGGSYAAHLMLQRMESQGLVQPSRQRTSDGTPGWEITEQGREHLATALAADALAGDT